MQLILALAVLLMLGGKSGAPHSQISSSDMLEMLKYVSGDNAEVDKIIKEAEQVTEIISAIVPLATAFGTKEDEPANDSETPKAQDIGIILQPVANIADDSIYNALSHSI